MEVKKEEQEMKDCGVNWVKKRTEENKAKETDIEKKKIYMKGKKDGNNTKARMTRQRKKERVNIREDR